MSQLQSTAAALHALLAANKQSDPGHIHVTKGIQRLLNRTVYFNAGLRSATALSMTTIPSYAIFYEPGAAESLSRISPETHAISMSYPALPSGWTQITLNAYNRHQAVQDGLFRFARKYPIVAIQGLRDGFPNWQDLHTDMCEFFLEVNPDVRFIIF